MKTFAVPTREQVSPANQAIFDNLTKALGMVPNLYATMAYSENGLGNYVALQSGKSSLRGKEREAINLIVSQVNGCIYCQSAHTVLGKMNG
ncbi:MAG: carboxymuconolactone decarboxylase family protein, partial [Mucilaginibacter sp.]